MRVLVTVGVCLLAGVLTAGLGEMAVRYRERHRAAVPGTMPLLFYRHHRLGHALVRNADYFGWIHVNSQGFRGPEISIAKQPGVLRLMTVGGSTTFDSFVSGDERAWPARLQFWLRELAPGRSIEVINAGVPGYRVIDDLIRLETELYRLRPDMIILYQSHNDLFHGLGVRSSQTSASNTPDEARVISPWSYWLSRHSLLYTKLQARWKAIRARAAAANSERAAPADAVERGAEDFERDVGSFLAVARNLGIRVVLPQVVHVSGPGRTAEPDTGIRRVWTHFYYGRSPDMVLGGFARYDAALRAAARRFGATYVPTTSFGLRGTEWYVPDDPIHFSDVGADRMGRMMAETLLRERLLAATSPPTGS